MDRNGMILSGMVLLLFSLLSSFSFAEILPEDPASGERIFAEKGCAECHATKAEENKMGPHLGNIDLGNVRLDIAAEIWNHIPSMVSAMERLKITKTTLTGQELSTIATYLYFLRFLDKPGNYQRGKSVFTEKGCHFCHLPSGEGMRGGPGLDSFPRNMSPVFLSQAIWNHSLDMIARMARIGMKWPKFRGTEIMDLLEYIKANAKGAEEPAFFRPANPKEGKRVFDAKGCNKCHSIGQQGAKERIDLGRVARTFYGSLTEMVSSMWNKGPELLVKMFRTQTDNFKFTPKEMVDLLAYLYFLGFVDEPGNVTNGKRLFSEMGCSECHGLEKKQDRLMYIDLSKYHNMPQTEIVASFWNHSIEIQRATKWKGFPWPQFKKGEMADLLEFIRTPQ